MPKFNVQVPHSHSKEVATDRLNRFIEVLQSKFQGQVSDLQQTWNGDVLNFSFKTFGIPLKGEIAVGENALDVNGELPFTAMMFKGKIESSIREELERLMKAGT